MDFQCYKQNPYVMNVHLFVFWFYVYVGELSRKLTKRHFVDGHVKRWFSKEIKITGFYFGFELKLLIFFVTSWNNVNADYKCYKLKKTLFNFYVIRKEFTAIWWIIVLKC